MSDMKCPFCQQEFREIYFNGVRVGYICPNPNCKPTEHFKGNKELWQELIRTRKALDVAIRGLDQMTWGCDSTDAEYLLKETKTTLEQKD